MRRCSLHRRSNLGATDDPASALNLNKIETALDPLNPLFNAVEPAVNASQAFFDVGGSHFEILHVANEQIDPLFHSRKPRLDLLEHWNDEVSDFAHAVQHICSRVVPQVALEATTCP